MGGVYPSLGAGVNKSPIQAAQADASQLQAKAVKEYHLTRVNTVRLDQSPSQRLVVLITEIISYTASILTSRNVTRRDMPSRDSDGRDTDDYSAPENLFRPRMRKRASLLIINHRYTSTLTELGHHVTCLDCGSTNYDEKSYDVDRSEV